MVLIKSTTQLWYLDEAFCLCKICMQLGTWSEKTCVWIDENVRPGLQTGDAMLTIHQAGWTFKTTPGKDFYGINIMYCQHLTPLAHSAKLRRHADRLIFPQKPKTHSRIKWNLFVSTFLFSHSDMWIDHTSGQMVIHPRLNLQLMRSA